MTNFVPSDRARSGYLQCLKNKDLHGGDWSGPGYGRRKCAEFPAWRRIFAVEHSSELAERQGVDE